MKTHPNLLYIPILLLTNPAKAAAPVPTPNGFCFSYIIQGYDTCALIAQTHDITEADIESFNANTWAWLGCSQLYQGDFICLSTGNPPMPMALPNAVCGPQVPGTTRPDNWADLANLNPCPASQCCATWGQCETSADFCNPEARKPPAGVTATVSAATEVEPVASTLATQVKPSVPTQSGTHPGTTAQPADVRAGTVSVSASVSASAEPSSEISVTENDVATATTDNTFKPTDEAWVFPPPWTTPWEITWYSEKDCAGDYYHMEGYNADYISGVDGCLNLRGGLNSVSSETNVTCKWWTDGGLTSTDCDSGTLEAPQSWIVKNGVCMVFNGQKCDCFDHYALSYRPHGCHNRTPRDTPHFMSFECHIED